MKNDHLIYSIQFLAEIFLINSESKQKSMKNAKKTPAIFGSKNKH